MLFSSHEKNMANIFRGFLNFFEIYPEASAEEDIQRKLEKREKYAIFLEWLNNNMFIINAQNIRDD